MRRLLRYFGFKPVVGGWIERFSSVGDVVFDPFGGAGSIVFEALSRGRRAIYLDLNPYIVFVVRTLVRALSEVDPEEFVEIACRVVSGRKRVPVRLKDFRLTYIDTRSLYRVNGVEVKYVLWERDRPVAARTFDDRWVRISEEWGLFPYWPYHSYPCGRIWYSDVPFYTRRCVDHIYEFFTRRNLVALSTLLYDIEHKCRKGTLQDLLKVAFLLILHKCSKMARVEGGSWPYPKYWIPRRHIEANVYWAFMNSVKRIANFLKKFSEYKVILGEVEDVLAGSADIAVLEGDAKETQLPDECVDYVITDPPMLDEIQYLELSYFYLSWIRREPPFEKEVVINPNRGVDEKAYYDMLGKAVSEVYRVLKDGKYFTLIVHDLPELKEEVVARSEQAGFRLIRVDKVKRLRGLNFKHGAQYECYITFCKA